MLGLALNTLMFHQQQNSAADLSMLVLETLEKSEAQVEEDILGKFAYVFLSQSIQTYSFL